MTTGQIDQAFIKQYDAQVKLAYQRKGALLRNAVYQKTGVGATTITFQQMGKVAAALKYRHADIALGNITHTPTTATMADYAIGDYVDKLDEMKTNIDARAAIATSNADAVGRQMDALIIAAADAAVVATSYATPFTLTSYATIRQSALTAWETMGLRDVVMDDDIYAIVSPSFFSVLMNLQEFSNSQWVGPEGMTFPSAQKRTWLGMHWISHTGLTISTGTTRRGFLWHKRAMGFGVSSDIEGEVWYDGRKKSNFVSASMSAGAVCIDTEGVQAITLDEAATRPTS